jgi:hypothetical protein
MSSNTPLSFCNDILVFVDAACEIRFRQRSKTQYTFCSDMYMRLLSMSPLCNGRFTACMTLQVWIRSLFIFAGTLSYK